ncbi:MAG: LysM peptidoglycan-binding domain-containing protein [Candidatus Flexifilum sp.]|jgi:LysM repeat protein
MRRLIVIVSVLLLLAAPVLVSAQTGGFYHVVQYGETLSRIAARYGVNMWSIAAANNIYNLNHIYAGQVLLIPSGTVTPPVQPPVVQPPVVPGAIYYTVLSGDTLGSIARAFGSTVAAIAAANNLANPSLIYPGQVLIIPRGTTPPVVQPPVNVVRYVVMPGDQLRFIAARYNTTWQAIATYNNLANPNLIYAGQVLLIPQ